MPMCLDLCFHMPICLDLCFLHALYYTQSRPYGLCPRPYTKAHIKGFGSPIFACLCLFTSMLYACVSLYSSRLCHSWCLSELVVVWLHLTPMRPCLGVATWDAFPDARLFHAYPSLFCFVRWYACHACLLHPLAFYASLHTYLHDHAWVLLASVLFMLQHNEVMDIQSKPTFVPHKHHLLFALLLVCLLSCLLACLFAFLLSVCLFILWLVMSPVICYACHAYLLYASFICSLHLFFPLLVYWFLVLAFACTHMERECIELGHSLPGTSKRG